MKLYERIENNNFDEIDRNRAIELIEGGNGHLVYNENYFKLQQENEEKDKIKVSIRECKDVEIICPNCGEKNIFYDVDCGETNSERCWSCDETLEFYVSDF